MYILYIYIFPVRELIYKEDDEEGPAGGFIEERLDLHVSYDEGNCDEGSCSSLQ